jgi:enoyl-CoA hydratase
MALPSVWPRRALLAHPAVAYPAPGAGAVEAGRYPASGNVAGNTFSEVSTVAFQNLTVQRDDNVAVVTINRPQVRNALNIATLGELADAFDELAADPTVRAVVCTGAGDRAFVAGADINELRALSSSQEAEAFAQNGQDVFFKIEQLEKPVVMAINGYALGGGCELALAGDIRLAADNARFGQPEINLGIIPGFGGTQRLPRLIGKSAAKLMILSGEPIDAQEALRLGLVDRVYPPAELLPAALALAKSLATKAPVALAYAKQAINQGLEFILERGLGREVALFGQVCTTEDRVEGTSAFLEKRPPVYKGR